MITFHVLGFEVSTTQSGDVGSAPQPIHDSAFGVPEIGGRSLLRGVLLKDQVVKSQRIKEGLHHRVSNLVVHVATNNELIAVAQPLFRLRSQVFPKCHLRISVIVLAQQVTLVLAPNRGGARRVGNWSVNAHAAQDHAILAPVSGPRPSTKFGLVATSAHGQVSHRAVGEDAGASPLAASASEVAGVVKASSAGAVGVEGMIHALAPLTAAAHLGPVAAQFLKEENINLIVLHGLEQSCLGRALWFEKKASMIQAHESQNIRAFGAKEITEVNKLIIGKVKNGVLFCEGVGVVGMGVVTDFNVLLGSLPVPSSGRPTPFSRLCCHAQPVYLPREGPHWGLVFCGWKKEPFEHCWGRT